MASCRVPSPSSAGGACCSGRRPWRRLASPPPRAASHRRRPTSTTSWRNSTWRAATASWPATPPTTANPPMRPALAAVSSERSKHAEALSDEIARMTGRADDVVVDHDDQRRAGERADREGRRRRAAKVRRQRGGRGPAVRLPRRAARLDRRVLHGGLHGSARHGSTPDSPRPRPARPPDAEPRPSSTRWPLNTRSSTATGWFRHTPPR